ncbi:uncharacterized protein LOC143624007 [Bidens hawaiensis]|uniref:uncharacterized protein LOC143624007 n=1 Tax=Bidens hawaiensis TaxID=980011 RepID=UPI00404963AF
MLNEIDVLKTSPSTVKVRVLRVWSINDNKHADDDFLIEMVLMDKYKNQLQATIFKDIFRFKRFSAENANLIIMNHGVGLNGSNYKRKFMSSIPLALMSAVCLPILFGLLNENDVNIRRPIPVNLLTSLDEEFLKATYFYNICEIYTIIFPKNIILLGTIKAICLDTDWYYIGCSNCSRNLMVDEAEGGKVYKCKNPRCNAIGVVTTDRYKIKIRIQDSTGVVSLTLFDRDAKFLIKKPTSDLIDVVVKGRFPSELDCLLDKKIAFKFDIADFNFRYSVEDYGIAKLTDDDLSDTDSVKVVASVFELQSTSSLSINVSDICDTQTPSSNVDVEDETKNNK